jgi:hypothetical protein
MPRRPPTRPEVERYIRDLAELHGWRHHHARFAGLTRDGYADGFPPEVLLRDGRLLFITIAGAGGALAMPEMRWTQELDAARIVEMHLVQRGDLSSLARALAAPAEAHGPTVALPLMAGSRGPPCAS